MGHPKEAKMSESQFRQAIEVVCRTWGIPDSREYLCSRYWPAFSQLDAAGQRAFWDTLGGEGECGDGHVGLPG
jgi:hypothetical protein